MAIILKGKVGTFSLASLSGILLILIFPIFDLWFIAWFALVPLLLSVRDQDRRIAFSAGFIAGFIYFLGTLYWVVNAIYYYGPLPFSLSLMILIGMIMILSLYVGVFGLLYNHISRMLSLPSSMLAPIVWTSLELVRTYILSGFPWSSLGYSQYRFLPIIQVAEITGVYGISFLIVMVNGMVVDLLSQIRFYNPKSEIPCEKFQIPILSLSLSFLLIALGYGYWRLNELSDGKELKVAVIQGNIEQDKKWDPIFQREVFDTYLRLTNDVLKGSPDIIVWPETATPFYFGRDRAYTDELISFVKGNKIYLLFGSPRVKSFEKKEYSLANSAYLISPTGDISGPYDKIHLVPFGEYVPMKRVLFFVNKLVEGIGDFTAGDSYEVFETEKGRFGVVICYEVIFPGLVRKFVDRGAEFMITITNDAWFGKTSAPYQHFSMAVLRAVENRVAIARAANTGVSGYIDSKGRILRMSEIFHEGRYLENLRTEIGKSFYTRHGDIFAYIALSLTLFLLYLSLFRSRRLK